MLPFKPVSGTAQAFEGAYGGFLVTDFYGAAQANADKERQQGIDAVDAAKQVGTAAVTLCTSNSALWTSKLWWSSVWSRAGSERRSDWR